MSPRAVDPLSVNDPWAASGNRATGLGFVHTPPQAAQDEQESNAAWAGYANNNSGSPPRTSQYTLPARAGDRTGLIFGGFGADTDRADIEDCLRKIMTNVDGVEKIQALGKFAIAGKVTFTDNDLM